MIAGEAKNVDNAVVLARLFNEAYDEGDYVFQAAVRLDAEDTPEQIAERVLRLEHGNYWRVLRRLAASAQE